ncbi:MAG: hypothetical protein ABJD97_08045 [Betaproteobacteria bacterium]
MSSKPPITPADGAVRERLRDLLALHSVQAELAPLKLAIGFGQIARALDVVCAADGVRGGVIAAFGLPRPALAHQLRRVLAEAGR